MDTYEREGKRVQVPESTNTACLEARARFRSRRLFRRLIGGSRRPVCVPESRSAKQGAACATGTGGILIAEDVGACR